MAWNVRTHKDMPRASRGRYLPTYVEGREDGHIGAGRKHRKSRSPKDRAREDKRYKNILHALSCLSFALKSFHISKNNIIQQLGIDLTHRFRDRTYLARTLSSSSGVRAVKQGQQESDRNPS